MSTRSKDIISSTLLTLMETSSFNEITVSEICSNALLARKTFYNNFDSKEDVISYAVEKLVLEYHETLSEVNVYSPLEISYLFFCFGKKHEKFMTLLIENNLYHLFKVCFETHLPAINALVPQNKLNVLKDDQLRYVFAFHTSGVLRMLELWIEDGFTKTAREMSHIYHTLSLGVQDE